MVDPTGTTTWSPMPAPPALADGEVHVWLAGAPAGPSVGEMSALLSDDERERAARYRFARHRERFVAWRGLLRTLLGLYLGVGAASLRFAYNEYGKPAVEGGPGHNGLRFNLAHSDDLALYVFARGREVGVDVERVREEFAGEEVAERFFSPAEAAGLRALPAGERARAFFECWTRKEAYIKARGRGLSLPLDSFDVAFGPGRPAALLAVRDDSAPGFDCSLYDLTPAPHYAAALAAAPAARSVSHFKWEGTGGGA